jgi:hypothetical protein
MMLLLLQFAETQDVGKWESCNLDHVPKTVQAKPYLAMADTYQL